MRRLLLISIGLLLVLTPLVLALGTTTNPSPTIEVDFDDDDEPISILDAVITYPSGSNLTLNSSPTPDPTVFLIEVNTYLFPGEYAINVVAEDGDGNVVTFSENFTILPKNQNIWVEEPDVPYIPDERQDFAIGDTTSFNMTIETTTPTVCRIKEYFPNSFTNLSHEYLGSGASYFNGNQQSEVTLHTINVSQGSGFSNDKLFVGTDEFDYDNPYNDDYIAICRQFNTLNNTYQYFGQQLFIGYDLTDPVIDMNFDPNPITDPAVPETDMTISSGDLLFCDYEHIINPGDSAGPYQDDPNGTKPTTTITSLLNYSQEWNENFDFYGRFFNQTEEFSVQAMCRNPAQLSSTAVSNYTVELDYIIHITLEEDFFSTQSPTLNITTNIQALCTAQAQGNPEEDISTSGFTTQHDPYGFNVNQDGTYLVNVSCDAPGSPLAEETFGVTIDSTPPPAPILSTQDASCGDPKLRLEITNATEDVMYNITLTMGGQQLQSVIKPATHQSNDLQHSYTMTTNATGTATWSVFAIDEAGNEGPAQSITTSVTAYDPLLCDTTPPQVTINTADDNTTFTVSLDCEDPESGCQPTYQYALHPNYAANCTYGQQQAVNTSMNLTSSGKFCYSAANKAGLTTNGSVLLTRDFLITLVSPSNGVATSATFPLEVSTNRNGVCRHGPSGGNLTLFATTGSLTHDSPIQTASYTEFSGDDEVDWLVSCTENGLVYNETFTLVYDGTPPEITIDADPNPITDPEDLSTEITVTTDDKTVCTYLEDGVPAGFPGYDPQDPTAYKTSHKVTVTYSPASPSTVTQSISCRNLGGLHSTATHNITLAPSNELGITFQSPNVTSNDPYNTRWTTTRDAECRYRITSSSSFKDAQDTGGLSHAQTLSLNDGEHDIEVICELPNGDLKSYATMTVLVDTMDPRLELYTQHPSCTQGELVFVAAADGTGTSIASRYAELFGEEDVLLANGTFDTIQHALQITDTGLDIQFLEVTVTDGAGNSQTESVAIPGEDSCDTAPPQASMMLTADYPGFQVAVECTDDMSCAPSYLYTAEACLEDETTLQDYVPFKQTEQATLCYWAYDEAGNLAAPQQETITINAQCFNGIQDPNEGGLDCGGPCLAQCDSCSNGVQDTYEEGVDCGGVCSDSCTEEEFIPDEQKKTTQEPMCEADADCPPGYNCVDEDCLPDEESSFSWLGLILLILGILMVAGGVYYIMYSQRQKAHHQPSVAQQAPSAPPSEPQKTEEQLRHEQEALRKRHEREEAARKSRVKQREEQRKSLFEQFDTPEEETSSSEKPSQKTEEYIHVDEFNKKNSSLEELREYTRDSDGGMEELDSMLDRQQVLSIVQDPQVAYDHDKLVSHFQELLDEGQVDIPLINNVLQELTKDGSITRQDIAKIIKRLTP